MKKRWDRAVLDDVCVFLDRRGVTPEKLGSRFVSEGYRVISAKNIKRRQVDIEIGEQRFVDEPTYRRWMQSPLLSDDVLLTSEAPLGEPAYIEEELKWCLGQRLFGIRTAKSKLYGRFLFYALQASPVRDDLLSRATGATAQGIRQAELKKVGLPLPPLADQQRIVGVLDEAFAGLATAQANAEKNLQNARALFENHLQSIYLGPNRGQPERRLEEICSFGSGGTPSKNTARYWKGSIPWVSGRDMKSTQLSDTTLHISQEAVDDSATRVVPPGTLLMLVRGMGLAHGSQIAELIVPCAFNQDIKAIHPASGVVPRYLLFALQTRVNHSDKILSNAAHGTLKIDTDELRKVQIPVPPVSVQQRVANQIDALAIVTQRLEQIYEHKLAALAELKKSLLHQAFSGEL